MQLNKKSVLFLCILLIISVLLLIFFHTDNGLYLFAVFLILWFLLIVLTIKPLSRFQYRMIFQKSPTEKQLTQFILGGFVFTPLFILYGLLNIKYPTTPLNYFFRTVIIGFLLIGIYVIYKYIKKEKIYIVKGEEEKPPSVVHSKKVAMADKDIQQGHANHLE